MMICLPIVIQNLMAASLHIIDGVMIGQLGDAPYAAVTQAARELADPLTLMYPDEIPDFNKYDRFLPPQLVRKGFACGVLDLNGMRERVRQWERFVRKP